LRTIWGQRQTKPLAEGWPDRQPPPAWYRRHADQMVLLSLMQTFSTDLMMTTIQDVNTILGD
jgi:hypothetical protein